MANADETSWRQAGRPCWLWVVVSGLVRAFPIARGRGSAVLRALLGEGFAGVVGSARRTADLWPGVLRRQPCWAHLTRDFRGLVGYGGAAQAVGQPALEPATRPCAAWHQVRDDPAAWPPLPATMAPIQEESRALLETGQASSSPKAAGLRRDLLKLWPARWTLVSVRGVAPTHNAAERALRPAVLWRNQSLGTPPAAGTPFVPRLLPVAATCQQQQRSLLHSPTAVCSAAPRGDPIPPLLPTPSTLTPPAALAA